MASWGHAPLISLLGFVSWMGDSPETRTHSPINDEMGAGVSSLHRQLRPEAVR